MKIMVPVKRVIDYNVKPRVKADGTGVDLANVKMSMNPFDEIAVEEAIRLREKGVATEVLVVSVGPAKAAETLRTALAMGADRAILVETETPLDVIATSSVVAQVAKLEAVDLIFCGGGQADWDSHALGAATAERLGWPQATWTSALTIEGLQLTGTHDVDAGKESFTMALPAVVTTQQGLNDPRYPTLPNIMKAKRKEMRKLSVQEFSVTPRLKVLSTEVQVKERKRKMLDGKDAAVAAHELVDLLRNEARVIG